MAPWHPGGLPARRGRCTYPLPLDRQDLLRDQGRGLTGAPEAALTSAARLKYLYGWVRENQVCAHSRWDCGMVTGTC